MLELINIKKDYPAGAGVVEALKGISIKFRDSEFVSVLGPSGCGKTTALNIIGGLDQYTSGDLIINGKSTKNFKDRDWDSYRNHSVGFVFQNYNLIPHQSVLQNVELALSLSGVSKAQRKSRAIAALEKVGLGDQLYKKPGEMSGGQMQRVAIARAIVNNPDIVLADEPTGALDTETSLQVMEILKEISKDRLVVMVTHNPELAEHYSTRIIRMIDGVITGDSNPLTESAPVKPEKQQEKPVKKPSMSLFTSFGLSLKNLFTKKGRTILTSFAGSIGIIGIALIFAVSNGMTNYINVVQEETLSSYPLTLEATRMDMTSLLTTFMGQADAADKHDNDAVYQKSMTYKLMNALISAEAIDNDLEAFKKHIESERSGQNPDSKLYNTVTGVQYTYNMNMLVYTKSVDGTVILSDVNKIMEELMAEYFGMDMSQVAGSTGNNVMTSLMGGMSTTPKFNLWQEMLSGDNGSLINPVLEKQYDVVYGSWPNSYDEIVLVVDKNNEVDDMSLYALGLTSKDEIDRVMDSVMNKEEVEIPNQKWSFEEICSMDFRTVLGSSCYRYDKNTGLYYDLRSTESGLSYLYENALKLKVSGIIRPKEDATSTMLTGSIGYTSALTKHIMAQAEGSEAVKAQLASSDVDIFTGLPFKESTSSLTPEQKQAELKEYLNKLTTAQKATAFKKMSGTLTEAQLNALVEQAIANITREEIETNLVSALSQQMGMDAEEIKEYLAGMDDAKLKELYKTFAREGIKAQTAAQAEATLAGKSNEELAAMLNAMLPTYTLEQCDAYYDAVVEFSKSTYENNLKELGYVDINSPSTINLYTSSFENKDIIKEAIEDYNATVTELEKITYVDYVGIIMSSITTIIDAITYVLVSFVAVSLIVSAIMIGVITLISVQERTKEIGILRAIGASKRNVSTMFNAETVIIGFTSGVLGVGLTYLLCLPINAILHALTGIENLSAYLPIEVALALVVISTVLTLISGIIPSKSAAKKDPVVALRTE